MGIDVKSTIQNACRLLLRPIALVVLKCGMTWKEFADLSKSVFVQTASEAFGIKGRPTNVSRVSILTGISRKEVKRQRDLLAAEDSTESRKTTDASRVLSGWHQDPEFLDSNGEPLSLPEHGPSPSFSALFSRYGGDTPEQTLVKELQVGKCIEKNDAGQLIAKSRYYMPVAMSEENIRLFGTHLYDHAQTLNINVTNSTGDAARFEGRATNNQIDPSAVADFEKFVSLRGQQFLEEVDDWLSRHCIDETSSNLVPVRLGLGVYAIDGLLPGEEPNATD